MVMFFEREVFQYIHQFTHGTTPPFWRRSHITPQTCLTLVLSLRCAALFRFLERTSEQKVNRRERERASERTDMVLTCFLAGGADELVVLTGGELGTLVLVEAAESGDALVLGLTMPSFVSSLVLLAVAGRAFAPLRDE